MIWPFKKKKAKAVTPPPPADNGEKERDPNEDTKAIQIAFEQSERQTEDLKKKVHGRATDVKHKAAECVKRLSKKEGVG